MAASASTRESVVAELERVLSSTFFEGAGRSRAVLKFVVEETLSGRADRLKEYTIGAEALGKGESFDPRTDPIVRAEVSRLRTRLDHYYASEGLADPVVITLPKGSYVPQFVERRERVAPAQPSPQPGSGWSRNALRIVAAVLLVVCSFAAGMLLATRLHTARTLEHRIAQVDVALTSQGEIGGEVGPSVALSPDGTRLVFVAADSDGVSRLHLRRMDQAQELRLPGTDGARGPFFSPDGAWIGFWSGAKLKKTSAEGGSPIVLCDAPDLLGASWGEDSQIVASFGGTKLFRVPASGGTPAPILDLSPQAEMPTWPQILRGGRIVLFTAIGPGGPNQARIEALSLDTGKRTVLIPGGTFGRAFADAWLTFVNQGTLFAVAFDSNNSQVHGSPLPVLQGVSYSSAFGYAEMDFSQTGDLVFRKRQGNEVTAQWFDRSGFVAPMISKPGGYLWPRLSPDGRRLAMSVTESGESSVQVYDSESKTFTRIPTPAGAYLPVWTPNGRFLVLGCRGALMWVRSDGTGKAQPLLPGNKFQVPWSFSPDGSRLAYHELGSSTALDLWTVPVHFSDSGLTAGTPEVFLQTPSFEVYPTFSPDGHWMAYGSNESGTWEVYVRAVSNTGVAVRVSNGGGRIPFFSPSGDELIYRTDSQRIMTAHYSVEHGSFVVHSVQRWSPARLADTGVFANLDYDSRHDRVLGLSNVIGENEYADHQVTFIFNFSERVKSQLSSSIY